MVIIYSLFCEMDASKALRRHTLYIYTHTHVCVYVLYTHTHTHTHKYIHTSSSRLGGGMGAEAEGGATGGEPLFQSHPVHARFLPALSPRGSSAREFCEVSALVQ